MDITEVRAGGTTTLRVVGRVDSSVSKQLEAKVLAIVARDDRILVDLSGMNYVSSAGLRAFIIFAKHARARNRTIALCAMPEEVVEIFEISGLLGLFSVHDTLDAAAAALP